MAACGTIREVVAKKESGAHFFGERNRPIKPRHRGVPISFQRERLADVAKGGRLFRKRPERLEQLEPAQVQSAGRRVFGGGPAGAAEVSVTRRLAPSASLAPEERKRLVHARVAQIRLAPVKVNESHVAERRRLPGRTADRAEEIERPLIPLAAFVQVAEIEIHEPDRRETRSFPG